MKKIRGFTLIELLITIAIIAILAAVILPRIQRATDKGQEARIIASIESFGKSGMNEEIDSGTFDVVCGMNGSATSTKLLNLVESLRTHSDDFRCFSSATSFAASAQLETGRYWCVDSAGSKGEVGTTLPAGVTTCP